MVTVIALQSDVDNDVKFVANNDVKFVHNSR